MSLAPIERRLPQPVRALVTRPLESLLGLNRLNWIYHRATHEFALEEFCAATLHAMNITAQARAADLERIPRTGPLIVVANHPFGGIEGLILMSIVMRVRPDVKAIVNELLGQFPALHECCYFVDVFPSASSKQKNLASMRQSMRWVKEQHAMVVFPAGEVAHLELKQRRVMESKWNPHIAAMARRCGAAVVPVYFPGANGALFHLAGLIHPLLRTALLPRELANKRDWTCRLEIGSPITPEQMARFGEDDEAAVEYLRLRTEALVARTEPPLASAGWKKPLKKVPRPRLRSRPRSRPIAGEMSPQLVERDIHELPERALLCTHKGMQVYLAPAQALPHVLTEIGRLREIAFRAVGEGTGLARDLDRFDPNYQHIFIWDQAERQIVGAYRIGFTDRLIHRGGRRAVYLSTLFDFPARLLTERGPMLELGRSFVRIEYQKNFASLMMLWKGLGQVLCRHTPYRYMLGPVSISSRYSPTSRSLIARYLSRPEFRSPWAGQVGCKTPMQMTRIANPRVLALADQISDVDDLNRLIADIEEDDKGLPILLKHYLKLGAKAVAFNIDPAFGNCLDVLCTIDVLEIDRRTMDRYMGAEAAERLIAAHHGASLPPVSDAESATA